jgi:hypothetical protein
MEEYLGHYYVFKARTRVDARVYTLHITSHTQATAKFSLELAISGNFGSVGKTWKGFCFFNEDLLNLQCDELNDWSYTFLDEEKNEYISKISDTFKGILSKEGNDIKVDLSFKVDKVLLYKIEKDSFTMGYWASRKIIEMRDLEVRVKNYDPHRFWCISNLIFKDIKELESKTIEVVCEYDIEFRLEEKRVINADEIKSAHHRDRIVFDINYKIINYTFLT